MYFVLHMDYSNNFIEWNYEEDDISEKYLFFNVLKDGRIRVLAPRTSEMKRIPPADDVTTGVKIKDIKISADFNARVFLPPSPAGRLAVLFYVHGGGFCMGSTFSVAYTRFLTTTAAQSNVIIVSVEYRRFPTHHISTCYDDAWFALQWVASHWDKNFNGASQDPWIKHHADLTRIFVGGDSAGGNISHTLVVRAGKQGLPGEAKVVGMILIHPYFDENDKMWMYMCPINEGPRDPRMKPAAEDLALLWCSRVLVLVAEKDGLRDAGKTYVEELSKSGWRGSVDIVESKDKDHCFHFNSYLDPEAIVINESIKSLIHRDELQG